MGSEASTLGVPHGGEEGADDAVVGLRPGRVVVGPVNVLLEDGVEAADEHLPDLVVSELGHSAGDGEDFFQVGLAAEAFLVEGAGHHGVVQTQQIDDVGKRRRQADRAEQITRLCPGEPVDVVDQDHDPLLKACQCGDRIVASAFQALIAFKQGVDPLQALVGCVDDWSDGRDGPQDGESAGVGEQRAGGLRGDPAGLRLAGLLVPELRSKLGQPR